MIARAGLCLVAVLATVAGCGDDSSEGSASPSQQGTRGRSAEPTAGAETPEAERTDEETAPADPLADAFDVRRVRVEPDAHVGEVRNCAVGFAERRAHVGARERTRYPVPVVRRVAVRCASHAGWGWADLVFTQETADEADDVVPGRLVRARVLAPAGGFGDYPVLELVELGPTFEPPPPPAEPEAPEPAFDFGRAGDPGVVGSVRRCAVAFAGPIELVQDRDLRLHPYPEGTSHRLDVECLHEGGEAWIDLVFLPDEAPRALSIQRGATVEVRVLSAADGYAGRPVARLAPAPGEER